MRTTLLTEITRSGCGFAAAFSTALFVPGIAGAQARAGVVRVVDGAIPYEIQGSGPPVVFIHGYTQNMGDITSPAVLHMYPMWATLRAWAKMEVVVSKTAMIRARVEPGLKDRAEAMLEELGLSATSAITLFYRQIVQRRGLPFEVRLPNTTTRRAMEDARAGRGVVGAESMDELFSKLDARKAKKPARSKRRKARASR